MNIDIEEVMTTLKNDILGKEYNCIVEIEKDKMLYEALEQQQSEIEEINKANEWISVEDRLPPEDKDCSYSSVWCEVYIKGVGISIHPFCHPHMCWDDQEGDDYFCDAVGARITHWKPLPKPPEAKL